MNYRALILLTVTALWGTRALADAPDLAAQPATAPSAVNASPTTEPASTAPASGAAPTNPAAIGIATTQDATTQPATTEPLAAQSPTSAPTDALAATEPSTQPSTQPFATTGPSTLPAVADAAATPAVGSGRYSPGVYRPSPRILTTEFAILADRSIFLKGSKVTIEKPPFQPNPRPSGDSLLTPGVAEESLVFDGTTEAGPQFFAWLEDRTTLKMQMVQDGDKVANGNITAITLDALDYTTKGRLVHVLVGQNLRGEEAAPVPAADAPTTGPSPTTQPLLATPGVTPPAGTPAASGSSGDGGISVLERMRRRRAAELGQ